MRSFLVVCGHALTMSWAVSRSYHALPAAQAPLSCYYDIFVAECPSILPIQYNNCKCCYGIFRNKMSWDDAKKRCNSLGAHLLWIENSEEQAFLDMITQSSK